MEFQQWLIKHDIESSYTKFDTAGLTLQDLKSNNEDSLRELFDYIGCNPIEKVKLFTAIRLFPDAVLNHATKEVILLTKREQNILEKMDRKSATIDKCIEQVQNAINGFGVKCEKDIHRACDEMISRIEEYRKMFLGQLQNMRNTRKEELKSDLIKLQKLKENVAESQIKLKKIATISDKDKFQQMKDIMDNIELMETEEAIEMEPTKLEPEICESGRLWDVNEGVEEEIFMKYTDEQLDTEMHPGIRFRYYHPKMLNFEDNDKNKIVFPPIKSIQDQQQLLFDGYMRLEIFKSLSSDVFTLCEQYYSINVILMVKNKFDSESDEMEDLVHALENISDEMREREEHFMAYQILKVLAKYEKDTGIQSVNQQCYSYIFAEYLRDLKHFKEAEKYFLRCLEIDDDAGYNHSYGYLLYLMGDYDKALKYIKMDLEDGWRRPGAIAHLYHALVNRMLGNEEVADESLSKALAAVEDKEKMMEKLKEMMGETELNRNYLEKFLTMVATKKSDSDSDSSSDSSSD